MAFTPSNLTVMSLGSGKMTIATIADGGATADDVWSSSITDIQTIIPIRTMDTLTPSELAVSYTQSSGTIHIYRNSTAALSLLVISGYGADMTW